MLVANYNVIIYYISVIKILTIQCVSGAWPMTNIINTALHKFVLNTCDTLYANRQLITQRGVKKMIGPDCGWSAGEIELQVPIIINEWRLKNIAEDDHSLVTERVRDLEEQLCKYHASLDLAHKTITKLKCEMHSISMVAQQQRQLIMSELHALLLANKR